MKSGFLLDVVVGKRAAVFQLLSRENETLLVGGDTFLVLDLCFDIINGVGGLDLEGDRLSSKRLNEDLHASSETKNKMERRLLLDIVVGQGTTVLQLLAREDKALLVRGNTLLVLDLCLDIINRVRRLDLKSDCLSREGLDKDLHTATQAQHQVKGRLLLDVVIRKSAPVFELLSGKDEALLVGRNAVLWAND